MARFTVLFLASIFCFTLGLAMPRRDDGVALDISAQTINTSASRNNRRRDSTRNGNHQHLHPVARDIDEKRTLQDKDVRHGNNRRLHRIARDVLSAKTITNPAQFLPHIFHEAPTPNRHTRLTIRNETSSPPPDTPNIKSLPTCHIQGDASPELTASLFGTYNLPDILSCQSYCRTTLIHTCLSHSFSPNLTSPCTIYALALNSTLLPSSSGIYFSNHFPSDNSDYCYGDEHVVRKSSFAIAIVLLLVLGALALTGDQVYHWMMHNWARHKRMLGREEVTAPGMLSIDAYATEEVREVEEIENVDDDDGSGGGDKKGDGDGDGGKDGGKNWEVHPELHKDRYWV
ncbi:hypothetical protein GLAREA_02334 [Glarea lozoyensis ATCC 20868]|uniref:Apple domain-containing protein n=1 Tax=Glarea lozoyensis (strain ATCC 20868 / MF5171) TaxID=1116229 RepID=S3D2Z0_GLAL2|nr:uncharacterized protein GLAREA_02334 [Glarea lozoyensis ATCC 20868]EPE26421.1 hypothetical protein GLAREA_02334 [Glarea lozoyensis ATCC 20868]